MKNKLLLAALMLSGFGLSGCVSDSGQTERSLKRDQFIQQMEDAGRRSVDDLLRFLLPMCLNTLQGGSVDEAALTANGYVKKNALIGGTIYYINLIKPAGIGTYRVYTQINPGNAKECTIEKSLGTFPIKYLEESAERLLTQAGYTKLTDNGGTYKNRPLFSNGQLQFTILGHSTKDSGSAYLMLVKQ